jgi:hypothetical protein
MERWSTHLYHKRRLLRCEVSMAGACRRRLGYKWEWREVKGQISSSIVGVPSVG